MHGQQNVKISDADVLVSRVRSSECHVLNSLATETTVTGCQHCALVYKTQQYESSAAVVCDAFFGMMYDQTQRTSAHPTVFCLPSSSLYLPCL